MGGDENAGYSGKALYISIRTPAWGVTQGGAANLDGYAISIRTPAWGVTNLQFGPIIRIGFQFAPPHGG